MMVMTDLNERLLNVRNCIAQLRAMEDQLNLELGRTTEDLRDMRIVDDIFHDLLNRQVGFECFDPKRAFPIPRKTYVALNGRYVLLGFAEQADASRFFDFAAQEAQA